MDDSSCNEGFACAYEATHVEEAGELADIIIQLQGAAGRADAEGLFTRYHKIVSLLSSMMLHVEFMSS